jgi:hypothetical protein
MERSKAQCEYDFYCEQLKHYKIEEQTAVKEIEHAEDALSNAKARLVESKEILLGLRGGIAVFESEIQRLEKVLKQ